MVFIITQAHYFDIYARVCMYTCVCAKQRVSYKHVHTYLSSLKNQ